MDCQIYESEDLRREVSPRLNTCIDCKSKKPLTCRQIYESEDRLLVDPTVITVERPDFLAALAAITPASHRSAVAPARCLICGLGFTIPYGYYGLYTTGLSTPPSSTCSAALSARHWLASFPSDLRGTGSTSCNTGTSVSTQSSFRMATKLGK